MFTGIWNVLSAFAELFREMGRDFRAAIAQGLIYSIMGLVIYSAISISHEHFQVGQGLRFAFLGSESINVDELRARNAQVELQIAIATDKLTNQVILAFLRAHPSISRVRVSMIHNGVAGLTAKVLLHFDVTNSVARPGRDLGAPLQNVPLSEWSDFYDDLLVNKCTMQTVPRLSAGPLKLRMDQAGIDAFLVCPIVDVQNQVLGAIFAAWETPDEPPAGDELAALQFAMRGAGRQIGAAWDLKIPLIR